MIIPPEVKKKPLEYIILAIIFILGIYFYIFLGISPSAKRFIVAGIAGLYFFWSLFHHFKRGDLSISIVIEYLVIVLLGIVLLSGTFL